MYDLEGSVVDLETEPLILRQLIFSIHAGRDPLFLETNHGVHSLQHALFPRYQPGESQNPERGSGVNHRFGLASAGGLCQPTLQLRTDGSDVRERLYVIKEFARERKPVLSLDPCSGHKGGGDIPNVNIAQRVGGKVYVRVDEVVRAYCCADRGGLTGFDDLLRREGSDEQRRANCDPRSIGKRLNLEVDVNVRVTMLSSGCSLEKAHKAFSAIAFEAAYTAIGSGQVTAISSVISNQSTNRDRRQIRFE